MKVKKNRTTHSNYLLACLCHAKTVWCSNEFTYLYFNM